MNTKLHAVADANGRPLSFFMTAGQVSDYTGAAALLDDVAMIAKLTSATSTKAMAVVIDDAAVTPRYVTGLSPARELPIIWRITKGSLRNKLLIILPIALLLSQFAPWLLTPILMLGGAYLCYEGAEKISRPPPMRLKRNCTPMVTTSSSSPSTRKTPTC